MNFNCRTGAHARAYIGNLAEDPQWFFLSENSKKRRLLWFRRFRYFLAIGNVYRARYHRKASMAKEMTHSELLAEAVIGVASHAIPVAGGHRSPVCH
jgi:hypothetical protein